MCCWLYRLDREFSPHSLRLVTFFLWAWSPSFRCLFCFTWRVWRSPHRARSEPANRSAMARTRSVTQAECWCLWWSCSHYCGYQFTSTFSTTTSTNCRLGVHTWLLLCCSVVWRTSTRVSTQSSTTTRPRSFVMRSWRWRAVAELRRQLVRRRRSAAVASLRWQTLTTPVDRVKLSTSLPAERTRWSTHLQTLDCLSTWLNSATVDVLCTVPTCGMDVRLPCGTVWRSLSSN